MNNDSATTMFFNEFALKEELLRAVAHQGYQEPTPIQSRTIPHLLQGKDVIGQAQTGTGKTAAFALPLLHHLNLHEHQPQVLVLTPTRELAIQVSEAFVQYGARLRGLRVLPIYGGQSYTIQLRQLKQGVHVVVGTPGRVMDHLRRGTLQLDSLTAMILDEADEMLRMGFIDDVEWILEQAPPQRQMALFSATMPREIRRIAQRYLNQPVEVTIPSRTTTADTIRQRYWLVEGTSKLNALQRILRAEKREGTLIFVRTRNATVELTRQLEQAGFACAALNGDMAQSQRERMVQQFRRGKIELLIATDVAARGLDVERISHVINYDIPQDIEWYVHRIGRTGRAGRQGEAILFVSPSERHILRAIERSTRHKIQRMRLPGTAEIQQAQRQQFKEQLRQNIARGKLEYYTDLVAEFAREENISPPVIAAALARMIHEKHSPAPANLSESFPEKISASAQPPVTRRRRKPSSSADIRFERFRVEVGRKHGAKPGNIVGAIANEIGLSSEYIGKITLHDTHSTVDLPEGIPGSLLKTLAQVWVAGRKLQISRLQHRKSNSMPNI